MKKITTLLLCIVFASVAFPQKKEYITEKNIPYYTDAEQQNEYIKERCLLDIYYPKESEGFATIVWFHGGGLTGGEKEIPQALKDKGFCVVAPNYRLAPKATSPEYIEDAAAAIAWIFNNIGNYGGDPSLIFLSGHSAGGYLTLMAGLDKQWLGKHDIDADKIAGLIPFSAQTITHFTIRKERGIEETQPVADELAPLFHVRADAPPLLLITGDRELELLGRYEENAYLARMMKVSGHKNTHLFELQGFDHNMAEPAFPLLIKEVRSRLPSSYSL
jgi:Esterase/lipase